MSLKVRATAHRIDAEKVLGVRCSTLVGIFLRADAYANLTSMVQDF